MYYNYAIYYTHTFLLLHVSSVLLPPLQWPEFFGEMLQSIQSGHLWSVDLYLRILLAIDSEVVDRHIVHTQEVCIIMHNHKLMSWVVNMVICILEHYYLFSCGKFNYIEESGED